MKHIPFHTKKAKNYNGLKNHKKSASGFFFRHLPPPWSLVLGYLASLVSSVDFTGSYLTYLTERLGEEGLREVHKH